MKDLAKIEEICLAALQHSGPAREAFLHESCGADDELRQEVDSLLVFAAPAQDFIEIPPEDLAADLFAEQDAGHDFLGTQLNHYQILSKLGVGGMGEVYLAEDTKLGRQVAIKLLPAQFARDENRKTRFEREARAVSALNHPNIITIYGIEQSQHFSFIATELVDGKTLSERIAEKSLTWQETIEIGIQVAGALASAHSVGIIHRDIKPANIMIRRDGLVKVLDFGLAKLIENRADQSSGASKIVQPSDRFESAGNGPINDGLVSAGQARSEGLTLEFAPRISSPRPEAQTDSGRQQVELTKMGMVMGTINYMSPEQACGEKLDARTDVFSLGVVLYEMLSGVQPFTAENDQAIYRAIVYQKQKSLCRINPEVPPELEQVINQALKKNLIERYPTAETLRLALQGLQQNSNGSGDKASMMHRRYSAKWLLALVPILLIIFVLAYSGFLTKNSAATVAAAPIESIAVMPFVDDNGQANTEYLSDGMTETLINSLSQLPNVSVKARSAVFRYKGQDFDAKKIASDLNVQVILNGHVTHSGDQLNLKLELIDAGTENLLWSQTYVRRQNDLVSLQSEIARDVSSKLKTRLSGAEEAKVNKSYTANPEAYRLYLQGRYFWNKRSPENIWKSIDNFKAAVAIDPNYALAYVGLSDAYGVLEEYAGVPASECLPQGRDYALKALQIDEQISEAHASLGMIDHYLWKWDEAEKEFTRALELNPNYPAARQWYQIHLRNTWQLDKALPQIQKAQELDPLSGIIGVNFGVLRMLRNEPEQSIAEFKKTIDLDPSWWVGHFWLGMTYINSGRYEEALPALETSAKLSNRTSMSLGALGYTYAVTGKRREAQNLLKEVEKSFADHKALGINVASIYAGLGDKDQAFAWLEKDYLARSGQLQSMKWYPPLLSLHSDPRYHDLLRRMDLPD